MRCLYCGKELALLKRWTRSGQFCSEAHKKSYQDEYNRIGLSRLQQAKNRIAPQAAPQAEASNSGGPVALESQVVVEETPLEEVASSEESPTAVSSGYQESGYQENGQENGQDRAQEISEKEPVWEPTEIAGFIKGQMAEPVSVEIPAEAQPWEPAAQSPVAPEWSSKGEVEEALQRAAMLELKFRPVLSDSEHCAPEVKVSANEFAHAKASPPAAELRLANRLASAGLLRQIIDPRVAESRAAASVDAALSLHCEVEYRESTLLRLPLSGIGFLEEDADVILDRQIPAADSAASETAPAADEDILWPELAHKLHDSDHASQAEASAVETPGIAKLHEGINAIHEDVVEEHVVEEQVVEQTPVPEAAPEAMAPPSAPKASPQGQEQHQSVPAIDIPVKTFAPPKPAPTEGASALIEIPVFLPRLTGLPLRPKMGLVGSAAAPGSKKAVRTAAKSVQAIPEAKTPAESNPVAEPSVTAPLAKDKPAGQPARRSTWSKEPVPKAVASPPGPAEDAAPSATVTPATPAQESLKDKEPVEKSKQPIKPSDISEIKEKTKPASDVTRWEAAPDVKRPDTASAAFTTAPIEGPSFGVAKTEQHSLLNSFGVKVGIAAALVLLCITIYFVFGGKPQASTSNQAADQPGPSIMVGAGGWVEGWAGDPAGAHNGRQITIYRPSLKLSDYRIDFKGEIETKSLGWVFRAADPEDYYAIKLAIVTPGLQPKIALLKYIVKQGHETQVGKVPIDLNVKLDTLYTVRVDVRGPRFTTYIQGQLIDTWIDDQLKSGGVGFLNEREERGRVKSVSVSLLNGGK